MERPEYEPRDLEYELRQRRRWADLLRGFVVGLVIVGFGYCAYLNWEAAPLLLLLALVFLAVLVPPRYDPAIRLKEWLERNKRR